MSFLELLKIEFMKVKRSKIVPLIFIAPLLVVASGVASLSRYFTPEYTNAWPAMFIQSALVYAYYLLPFSMIVVCVMIAGRETGNNGILKMLALPVSRYALSIAKFCVLAFYLFMEMVVFLVVFVIAGVIATQTMGVTETLPILYLLKWCLGLFLTMLPCIAAMWAITVLFEKPLLSVGLNLLRLRIRRCGLFTRTVTVVISFPALSMTLQQKPPTPLFRCFRSCRVRSSYSVCFSHWLSPALGKKK